MKHGRPTTPEDYRAIQDDIFGAGKQWIVALDVAASTTAHIKFLRDCGAGPCLGIGASRGTGPLPEPDWGPEPIVLDVSADSMMEGIWASQAALRQLPDWAIERIERFDPDREARVIGTIFDDGEEVAGRAKFGRRLPRWRALEDKTVIDSMWQELRVPHAPYRVVPLDLGALTEVSAELDRGDGVVWAGDARSGFHGGAEFTRWIRTADDARETFERFRKFCDSARVMPFLEGIPCSIHGIVFPDWVIAGRPCEMLVLRQGEKASFRYATAATFWDPPEAKHIAMRELAKTVGDHLRDSVGFRGAFTIDGVMTTDGFRPTELNPRFGGALGNLVKGMKLGLKYIDSALMEGVDVDWNPRHLETLILEHAESNRNGRSNMICPVQLDEPGTFGLSREGETFAWCDPDDVDAIVSINRGPAAAGTYIGITYNSDLIPVGPSTAPLAADVINFLNAEWQLGLPRLTPAPDLFAVEAD